MLLSLLRILRKERDTIGQIKDLGVSASQAIDLLTHEAVMLSQAEGRVVRGIFDASDRPEEGGVIMWWNDFEKDARSVVRILHVSYRLCPFTPDMLDGHPRYKWYAMPLKSTGVSRCSFSVATACISGTAP